MYTDETKKKVMAKIWTGDEVAPLDERVSALERRMRTLEGVVYDQSAILSELRGQIAGLRARQTTSERTTANLTPKEKFEKEMQKLKDKLPVDVTDMFADVVRPKAYTEVKPENSNL